MVCLLWVSAQHGGGGFKMSQKRCLVIHQRHLAWSFCWEMPWVHCSASALDGHGWIRPQEEADEQETSCRSIYCWVSQQIKKKKKKSRCKSRCKNSSGMLSEKTQKTLIWSQWIKGICDKLVFEYPLRGVYIRAAGLTCHCSLEQYSV